MFYWTLGQTPVATVSSKLYRYRYIGIDNTAYTSIVALDNTVRHRLL
jgi:hypothetical protein